MGGGEGRRKREAHTERKKKRLRARGQCNSENAWSLGMTGFLGEVNRQTGKRDARRPSGQESLPASPYLAPLFLYLFFFLFSASGKIVCLEIEGGRGRESPLGPISPISPIWSTKPVRGLGTGLVPLLLSNSRYRSIRGKIRPLRNRVPPQIAGVSPKMLHYVLVLRLVRARYFLFRRVRTTWCSFVSMRLDRPRVNRKVDVKWIH